MIVETGEKFSICGGPECVIAYRAEQFSNHARALILKCEQMVHRKGEWFIDEVFGAHDGVLARLKSEGVEHEIMRVK